MSYSTQTLNSEDQVWEKVSKSKPQRKLSMKVLDRFAGVLIGKRGKNFKELRQKFGCSLRVFSDTDQNGEKTLTISGGTPENRTKVMNILKKRLSGYKDRKKSRATYSSTRKKKESCSTDKEVLPPPKLDSSKEFPAFGKSGENNSNTISFASVINGLKTDVDSEFIRQTDVKKETRGATLLDVKILTNKGEKIPEINEVYERHYARVFPRKTGYINDQTYEEDQYIPSYDAWDDDYVYDSDDLKEPYYESDAWDEEEYY